MRESKRQLRILIRNRVMWNRTYLRQLFLSNCVWTITDCSNIVAAESYFSTVPMALAIGYARLLARRSGVRIPVGKDFLSRQYTQTGSGAYPTPYSKGTGVLFLGQSGLDVRLTTTAPSVEVKNEWSYPPPPRHMPS